MGNCCVKGREIENSHTNHIFTPDELKVLEKEESQDYLPSNSNVYRKWLRQYKAQNVDNGLDKWFLMGWVRALVSFRFAVICFVLFIDGWLSSPRRRSKRNE